LSRPDALFRADRPGKVSPICGHEQVDPFTENMLGGASPVADCCGCRLFRPRRSGLVAPSADPIGPDQESGHVRFLVGTERCRGVGWLASSGADGPPRAPHANAGYT